MRPLLAPERFTLEHRLVDETIRRSTTAELLAVLVGDDAAAAFAKTGRLWALLGDTAAIDLRLDTRTRLEALVELERRLLAEPRYVGARVTGPDDAARLFARLALLEHEEFHVAFLTSKHVVIAVEAIARGGVTSVEIAPDRIFRLALRYAAPALILAHGHPGGDPLPSAADRELTVRLTQAGILLGIQVLDHIVVGHAGRAYSMTEGRLVRYA